MRRSPQKRRGRNFPLLHHQRRETDLDLHPIPRVRTESLDLDHVPQNKRGVDKVNLNLQEGTVDANIDHDQGVVHTRGLKNFHHVQREPGIQRIGNCCVRGGNLHPTPQTDILD